MRDFLDSDEMYRMQHGLGNVAPVNPNYSPWQTLYNSGNDQALIPITGFDFDAFHVLLAKFKSFFVGYTLWTRARDGTSYAPVTRTTKRGRPRFVGQLVFF